MPDERYAEQESVRDGVSFLFRGSVSMLWCWVFVVTPSVASPELFVAYRIADVCIQSCLRWGNCRKPATLGTITPLSETSSGRVGCVQGSNDRRCLFSLLMMLWLLFVAVIDNVVFVVDNDH